MADFQIRIDDLSGQATRDLLALHLGGMHDNSPATHVNALELSELQHPNVTFWSVWTGDSIAGIGALKRIDQGICEIKSMRTAPNHLRRGVAGILLDHIIREARRRGFRRVSLETGSGPAFAPAVALYAKRGFVQGAAFSDYTANDFSRFYHLDL